MDRKTEMDWVRLKWIEWAKLDQIYRIGPNEYKTEMDQNTKLDQQTEWTKLDRRRLSGPK